MASEAEGAAARVRLPFVGRRGELARLEAALDDALGGRLGVALVTGPAGIGKSRLVAEFVARESTRARATAVEGRSIASEGAPPYWPWTQVTRALLQGVGAFVLDDHDAAILAQAMPGVVPAPAAVRPQALGAAAARFRLFDTAARLLAAAARNRPLILILQDLHWADTSSLRLLEFATEELTAAPVLLVCTCRDEEVVPGSALEHALAALARVEGRERLELGGLDEAAVARLVEAAAGGRPTPGLAGALAAHTEGTPLFLTEVLRWLADRGELVSAAPPRPGALPIPSGVQEIIRTRLADLDAGTRALLESAAVLGRSFSLDRLAATAGTSGAAAASGLDPAIAARMVVRVEGEEGVFAFTHMLVREAIVRGLGEGARLEVHRRAARALEQLPTAARRGSARDLAHHWSAVAVTGDEEDVRQALTHRLDAAGQAAAQLAFEEAVEHRRAALALEARLPDDPRRRAALAIALGRDLYRSGEGVDAQRAVLEGAAVARGAGAVELVAEAALTYRLGTLAGWRLGGGDAALIALLEEALAGLPPTCPELRGRLCARLALEVCELDPARAEALAGAASEVARTRGGEALAEALCVRQIVAWTPEGAAHQVHGAAEAIEVARGAGAPEIEIHARHWRIADLLALGDIDGVDAEMRACAALAERLRQPLYLWWARYLRAMRLLLEGRLDAAEAAVAEAFHYGSRIKEDNAVQVFAAQHFLLRWHQGRAAELRAAVADLRSRYPNDAVWACADAFLRASGGEVDAAREVVRELVDRGLDRIGRNTVWLLALCLLAEACASAGDAESAAPIGRLLEPFAPRAVPGGTAAICFGPVARFLARLAAVEGKFDEALAHSSTALTVADRLRSPIWRAITLWDRAAIVSARGGPADAAAARRLRDEAERTAAGCGLALPGATPGRGSAQGAERSPLSDRERAIVHLAAAGLSAREIGERLFIGKRTVETHLANAYVKLGVGTRLELVRLVERGDPVVGAPPGTPQR